jgi:hypothetical protein
MPGGFTPPEQMKIRGTPRKAGAVYTIRLNCFSISVLVSFTATGLPCRAGRRVQARRGAGP